MDGGGELEKATHFAPCTHCTHSASPPHIFSSSSLLLPLLLLLSSIIHQSSIFSSFSHTSDMHALIFPLYIPSCLYRFTCLRTTHAPAAPEPRYRYVLRCCSVRHAWFAHTHLLDLLPPLFAFCCNRAHCTLTAPGQFAPHAHATRACSHALFADSGLTCTGSAFSGVTRSG